MATTEEMLAAAMRALQAAVASAEASATAAQATETASSRQSSDVRLLDKPRALKCATRDEKMRQWPGWKYEALNWLTFQDGSYPSEMQVLETQRGEPISLDDVSADTKRRSHLLFGLLASTLKGRLARIVRPITDRTAMRPGGCCSSRWSPWIAPEG